MHGYAPATEEDLAAYEAIVARLRRLPADRPVRMRAEKLAEVFVREGRRRRRGLGRAEMARQDAELAATTVTGATDRREDAPLALPTNPSGPTGLTGLTGPTEGGLGTYQRAHNCYVCKQSYRQVDAFYHQLCPACAAVNSAHCALSTDLRGRRALLTGGRVKIGFQLALMLLRDGAELTVTSRFPQDTLRRFRADPGSGAWLDRLSVVGIDLRDPRQVIGLCDRLLAEGRPLDILINNAAQTVRRPPEAYALLAAGERGALEAGRVEDGRVEAGRVELAPGFRSPGTELSLPALHLAPDEAGLLPDTAPRNSWSARLGELDPVELLETQLVNSVAPALLCDRLLPLLLQGEPDHHRYIVNVTAVEGRFAVRNKTGGHPHTNMAKAALNMLTRTSAAELTTRGVQMCAVDTGWITDENPAPRKARIAARGFRPPLDVVDGAARIYHPIVAGEAGAPFAGVFLKDYRPADW